MGSLSQFIRGLILFSAPAEGDNQGNGKQQADDLLHGVNDLFSLITYAS
jgi:hypothetical protein